MKTIDLPTGPIAYDDLGDGAPILLLHATLHDRTDWRSITERLATSNRVLALDWPGHGESPRPVGGQPLGARLFADVLHDFVTTLDLRNAVLIGNSVGGYAACRLAVTAPERVAGLITVQGAGYAPSSWWVRAYCRLLARPNTAKLLFPTFARMYMRATSELDRAIVNRVNAVAHTRQGAEAFSEMWRSFAAADADLRPEADQVKAPTLVIWGKKDLTIPRLWAHRAHHAIGGSGFALMDTGHLPFASDPAGFLAGIEPFIDEVASVAERTDP